MKTLFTSSLLATFLTFFILLAVTACGGPGGASVAGIGGSGYIASGTITGFGSVFVNGIEFETTSSTFEVDGIPGTQEDLAIGMVVKVNGSIKPDGISGTATGIIYDDDLQGPVSAFTTSSDGLTKNLTVLGVTVIADSSSTTFDFTSDANVNTYGFDNIAVGNNVEISGYYNSTGVLLATRIELNDTNFGDSSSIIEVKGTISKLVNTTFDLGNYKVDASTATINSTPDNTLVDGQQVEVKGTLSGLNIKATRVDVKNEAIKDIEKFELEGIITDYFNDGNFKINGINIDASNATLQRQPSTLTLANNVLVQVNGSIINNTLVASSVELEGGNVKIRASVSSVGTDTFQVTPVAGQEPITITVTSNTQIEDDVNDNERFKISDLTSNSDFVHVQGFINSNGGITATEIDVKEPGYVLLQGAVQSFDSVSRKITVVGIEIGINYPDETSFDIEDSPAITEDDFYSLLNQDKVQVVKVKDYTPLNGVADYIKIE